MLNSLVDYIFSTNSDLDESVKQNDEYRNLSDESYTIYDKLRKLLDIEQGSLLEQMVSLLSDVETASNKAYFKEGLKTGVRLAVECLAKT